MNVVGEPFGSDVWQEFGSEARYFSTDRACNTLAWFYSDAARVRKYGRIRRPEPVEGCSGDPDLLAEARLGKAVPVRDRLAIYRDLVCYDTAAPYGFRMESPFALAVFMLPATHVEHRLRGFRSGHRHGVLGPRKVSGQ